MTPEPQPELVSYTGTYVMYISEGSVIVTGREKFKNYKAVFPVSGVRELVSSAVSAERVLDEAIETLTDRLAWDIPYAVKQGMEDSIELLKELRSQRGREP